MAMIRCYECGKEISDSAERCPHCGCVTSRGETKSQAKALLIQWAITAVAFIGGIALIVSGINGFSIIKLLIGISLVLGGIIDMIVIWCRAKEINDQTEEKSVTVINAEGKVIAEQSNHSSVDRKGTKVVNADGTVVYDNGREWQCPACNYRNPSTLIRCYNCGRRQPE